MTEQQTTGRAPDYNGDGVAVWVNKDKNNKTYLSVKVLGHYVNCFKVEPKKELEKKIVKEAGYNEVRMSDISEL